MAYPSLISAAVELQNKIDDLINEDSERMDRMARLSGKRWFVEWQRLVDAAAQDIAEGYGLDADDVKSTRTQLMVRRRFRECF